MAASKNQLNLPRIVVVMGLLVGSLVLTGILAWQAQLSAASHIRTAENVLREYGLLVADEFVRRSLGQVGYYGYFQLANLLRDEGLEQTNWKTIRHSTEKQTKRAQSLARRFFVFYVNGNRLTTESGAPDPALANHLQSLKPTMVGEDEPFAVSRYEHNGVVRLVILVLIDGVSGPVWQGFEVDMSATGAWFEQALEQGPLLPESLARGAISNDVIYLSVTDPNGEKSFQTGTRYDPYLTVQKTVGDDYQGIFQDFVVIASIDPDIAPSLVIGGLPRSRLPLLLGLIVLSIGLLAAAIWLLRREQTIMRMRSDFVAQVSHELRTPLTQIRMFAETLLFDRVRNEQERHRSLEIINRESQRLSHLVDNVLRFSRKNNGHNLNPTMQALAPVIEQVAKEFGSQRTTLAIDLNVDARAQAKVDGDALRQILLNLLDNAQKYGPDPQTIGIGLALNNGSVVLAISDEGPGIPQAAHKRIWEGFYRLEREQNTAITGTGIGLSVVRELVTAQNGTCYVDSGYGPGTRIVIEFPKA